MGNLRNWAAAAALAILVAGGATAQVSVGQIDTFEDATTQNWMVGSVGVLPPTNVPTGGPMGADDNYLRLDATGAIGPSGRLTAFNLAQWAGDYTGAGVTGIEMDVLNLGQTDLTLRLLLANPGLGPPTMVALTAAAPTLPSGGGWAHVAFSVAPADLIALLGDPASLMGGVTELRILHGPDPVFPPEPIAGALGIDNIRALGSTTAPVPEPAAPGVLAASLVALGAWRRRARPGGRGPR